MNELIAIIFCGWITFLVVMLPLVQHIEFLRDSRKYEKETAETKIQDIVERQEGEEDHGKTEE